MNLVYAGIGDQPQLVTDDQWVTTTSRILAQDWPDQ